MKGIKIVFLSVFLLVFLSSCIWNKKEGYDEAKNELLWINEKDISSDIENSEDEIIDEYIENVSKFEESENVERKTWKYSVEYLTDKRFLTLDSLDNKNFLSMEVELTWKVLVNSVDKIVVSFSNKDSDLKDSSFTLQQYKIWDDVFLYNAFNRFWSLDFWKNEYIIEAYSWKDISKLKVILNIWENIENITWITEIINLTSNDLPTSELFWNPVEIWNQKFTYSDIKWLEIKNVWDIWLILDWESITEYLTWNLKSWFYWNTLRPIKWNSWVTFFVTRLSGDKYFYEKHYYLPNGIYWIISLDSWDWVDSSSLREKNIELSNMNQNYEILEISDILFKQILD